MFSFSFFFSLLVLMTSLVILILSTLESFAGSFMLMVPNIALWKVIHWCYRTGAFFISTFWSFSCMTHACKANNTSQNNEKVVIMPSQNNDFNISSTYLCRMRHGYLSVSRADLASKVFHSYKKLSNNNNNYYYYYLVLNLWMRLTTEREESCSPLR